MLCSLSGEEAQEPVVSPKSGCIFEKRLIESYIATTGKDPVSEDALSIEDLIVVKNKEPLVVPPKPAAFNSIPTMLAAFQNEWDALVLESFSLRKELHNARQELSAALYQYDAAVRVAGRAIKERDEAREALAELSKAFAGAGVEGGAELAQKAEKLKNGEDEKNGVENGDGDAMDTDPAEAKSGAESAKAESAKADENMEAEDAASNNTERKIPPENVRQQIQGAQDRLFPVHKKLKLSVPGTVSGITVDHTSETHSLSAPQPRIAVGHDGQAAIFDSNSVFLVKEKEKIKKDYKISSIAFSHTSQLLLAASDKVYTSDLASGDESAVDHKLGQIQNIVAHPGAPLSLISSEDRWAILDSSSEVFDADAQASITTSALHVDGRLLALGTKEGKVLILDTLSNEVAATLNTKHFNINKLQFAYNGYWLFVASHNGATNKSAIGSVELFDLRKNGLVQEFQFEGKADFAIDGSSQVLATFTVSPRPKKAVWFHLYNKKEKKWTVDAHSASTNEPLIVIERVFDVPEKGSSAEYVPKFIGVGKKHTHHFTVNSN